MITNYGTIINANTLIDTDEEGEIVIYKNPNGIISTPYSEYVGKETYYVYKPFVIIYHRGSNI